MKTQKKQQMISLSTIHLNDGSHGLPKNPRFIRDEKFKKLCASIKDFPEAMPARGIVVDEAGVILGGNMRYRACLELGMREIPATWVHRLAGLTVEQKRRFIIMDNRGFGEDDFELLANEWDMEELIAAGFDEKELTGVFDAEPVDAEPQIDRAEELNKVWKVKTGDLWRLGEHRLLCGDSTKAEDVARLLGDRKPVLMVTDPPYGVEYDANWRNEADRANGRPYGASAIGKVTNDDRADWCEAWALFPGDVIYSWHPAGATSLVHAAALQDSGFNIRMQIIWAKNQFPIGRGDYHVKHEPCWYCVREGGKSNFTDDRTQTTLWEIDKPHKSDTGHSTQKPIECMARPMRNHNAPEVYDPFLGSGTTMVAAQNLGRKCYGLEISPAYCAVILQRMTDAFPGIKIERVK
ncbi:MAG: DNA methyltransferase [Smithella sp.]